MYKPEINQKVAAKSADFAERECLNDDYEKERLNFAYYHGFKDCLDKACKYLSERVGHLDPAAYNYDEAKMIADFVDEFKLTMEE